MFLIKEVIIPLRVHLVFFSVFVIAQLIVDIIASRLILQTEEEGIKFLLFPCAAVLLSLLFHFVSSIFEGHVRAKLSNRLAQSHFSSELRASAKHDLLFHLLQRELVAFSKLIKSTVEAVLLVLFLGVLLTIIYQQFGFVGISLSPVLILLCVLLVLFVFSKLVGNLRSNAAAKLSAELHTLARLQDAGSHKKYSFAAATIISFCDAIKLLSVAQGLRSILKQLPSAFYDLLLLILASAFLFSGGDATTLVDDVFSVDLSAMQAFTLGGYLFIRVKAALLKLYSACSSFLNFVNSYKVYKAQILSLRT